MTGTLLTHMHRQLKVLTGKNQPSWLVSVKVVHTLLPRAQFTMRIEPFDNVNVTVFFEAKEDGFEVLNAVRHTADGSPCDLAHPNANGHDGYYCMSPPTNDLLYLARMMHQIVLAPNFHDCMQFMP